MRPGQRRPRIHFDPACRGHGHLRLAARRQGPGKCRAPPTAWSTSPAAPSRSWSSSTRSIPRSSMSSSSAYRLVLPGGYPRFTTQVHDLKGSGNEEWFPTLNTPHELARHRITLRVAGDCSLPLPGVGTGRTDGERRLPGMDPRPGARGGLLYADVRPAPRGRHPAARGRDRRHPGAHRRVRRRRGHRRRPGRSWNPGCRSWSPRSAPSPCRAA